MTKTQEETPTLVGWFILTWEAWPQGRQGEVVGKVNEDYYLVRWYSHFDGAGTHAQIVSVDLMSGWRLYDDQDRWHSECAAMVNALTPTSLTPER